MSRLLAVGSMPFDEPEYEQVISTSLLRQFVTGLTNEMRNVDHGQRIRAFQNENAAYRHRDQGLLCPQHRLRTAKTTQVENGFMHL